MVPFMYVGKPQNSSPKKSLRLVPPNSKSKKPSKGNNEIALNMLDAQGNSVRVSMKITQPIQRGFGFIPTNIEEHL